VSARPAARVADGRLTGCPRSALLFAVKWDLARSADESILGVMSENTIAALMQLAGDRSGANRRAALGIRSVCQSWAPLPLMETE